jgi:hypothetical protein
MLGFKETAKALTRLVTAFAPAGSSQGWQKFHETWPMLMRLSSLYRILPNPANVNESTDDMENELSLG